MNFSFTKEDVERVEKRIEEMKNLLPPKNELYIEEEKDQYPFCPIIKKQCLSNKCALWDKYNSRCGMIKGAK